MRVCVRERKVFFLNMNCVCDRKREKTNVCERDSAYVYLHEK